MRKFSANSFLWFTILSCFLTNSALCQQKPVNLNTISYEEMTSLPNVTEKEAKNIIEYRQKQGEIKSINELEKLIGTDLKNRLLKNTKLYIVPKDVWQNKVTTNPSDLHAGQFKIKTFSLEGYSIYFTFPSGGNMVIDTGSKSDADRLVRLIKNEMNLVQTKYKIRSLFGWKPRIDWLVITHTSPDRTGGLETILDNFNVDEIVTALTTKELNNDSRFKKIIDSLPKRNITHTNLVYTDELNLQQPEPSVRLTAMIIENPKKEVCMCLKFNFQDFGFLFPGDINNEVQDKILEGNTDLIKSTLLFNDKALKNKFKNVIAPSLIAIPNEENNFICDGTLLSISNPSRLEQFSGNISLPPETQEKQNRLRLVIKFSSELLFNKESSFLPKAVNDLKEITKILRAYPENRTGIEYNLISENENISSEKAWNLYSYLIKNGVNKEMLSVRSVTSQNKPNEFNIIVSIQDSSFEEETSELKPKAKEALDKLAKILQVYTNNKVDIEGNTDSVGDRTQNIELSSKWAWNVYSYLVKCGVNSGNLSAKGYGPDKPIASNSTTDGRSNNRHTDIILKK